MTDILQQAADSAVAVGTSLATNTQAAVEQLKTSTLETLRQVGADSLESSIKDAQAFILAAGPRVARYVNMYYSTDPNQKITLDELKSLLLGLADLAALAALTEAGYAQIRLEATRNILIQTVTSAVVGIVSKAVAAA